MLFPRIFWRPNAEMLTPDTTWCCLCSTSTKSLAALGVGRDSAFTVVRWPQCNSNTARRTWLSFDCWYSRLAFLLALYRFFELLLDGRTIIFVINPPLVSFGGVVAGTDSLACGLGSAYTSHATSASLRISLRIHHTPKPTSLWFHPVRDEHYANC